MEKELIAAFITVTTLLLAAAVTKVQSLWNQDAE